MDAMAACGCLRALHPASQPGSSEHGSGGWFMLGVVRIRLVRAGGDHSRHLARLYLGAQPFFLLNLQFFLASPFLHFFLDFFAFLQSFLTCFFELGALEGRRVGRAAIRARDSASAALGMPASPATVLARWCDPARALWPPDRTAQQALAPEADKLRNRRKRAGALLMHFDI